MSRESSRDAFRAVNCRSLLHNVYDRLQHSMRVHLLYCCSSVSLDMDLEDSVPLKPAIVGFSDSKNNLLTPQLQAIKFNGVFEFVKFLIL